MRAITRAHPAMDEAVALAATLPVPHQDLSAVVVIPAKDEAARIGSCLRALADQQDVLPTCFEVLVVLDGCSDRTPELVRGAARRVQYPPIHSLEFAYSEGVGRARRLGMDIAYERLLRTGRAEDGLIASTDADTIVDKDWLTSQLRLARGGAEAIGGLIELDPTERQTLDRHALMAREQQAVSRIASARQQSGLDAEVEHPHFSGASLALTTGAYRRCGGLPLRAALEDEALAQALIKRGIAIHRSRQVRVCTSARTDGRAPRGLARDLGRTDWRARRTYKASEFPLDRLLAAKQATLGLLLPARAVAETITPVARIVARLKDVGLLDEALVIDADSQDDTAVLAHRAGLEVVQENDLLPEYGPVQGKGDAMWRGLAVTDSEIVVYADTDTQGFHEGFLLGLIGPLLCEPDIQLVKGAFRRPFRSGDMVLAEGGGRVTELMARPLLNLHAPELAVFEQPLAGEIAARRTLLEQLPFSAGYGVEIAMLIDAWRACGLDGLAQVNLGERQNRHQSLRDLSAMAYAVLVAAQTRFLGSSFADKHVCGSVVLPPANGSPETMENRSVVVEERPPLTTTRPSELVRYST